MIKCKYYVAILHSDNSLKYVTKLDNATKTFYCEKGKPALPMSEVRATDVMNGMLANLCLAVIVKVSADYTPTNKE